jgi:hypothetical protein
MDEEMTHISIPIPYQLRRRDLVPEPDVKINPLENDEWDLLCEIDREELPRVLTAAVCLFHHHPGQGPYTFLQCLETAVIWERG